MFINGLRWKWRVIALVLVGAMLFLSSVLEDYLLFRFYWLDIIKIAIPVGVVSGVGLYWGDVPNCPWIVKNMLSTFIFGASFFVSLVSLFIIVERYF